MAAALEQLRVVVAALLERLHAAAEVLVQLRVVAALSAQQHAVVVLSARPRAWAQPLERLRCVVVLSAQLRAWAELLECSPFVALWCAELSYAPVSSSVCSLGGPCSHALAVSFQRLWSYVRLSRPHLCVRCYVLAQSYVQEPWCG